MSISLQATSATRPQESGAEDYRAATAKVLSFKNQPITLFDVTVAVLAQRTGLQVWTYDHHFDVMPVSVWR